MNLRCLWRVLIFVFSTLSVSSVSLFAQSKQPAPQNETEEAKRSREELQVSMDQIAPLRLQYIQSGVAIERVEHPILRYGAPLWGGHHGTMWIWGKRGRPVAVLEMSQLMEHGVWYQSLHATTAAPIQMTMATGETWTPKSSNVKFLPLPGAPSPADTPSARLRQMKAIVQKCAAHQLWTWEGGDGGRHELRMLTTPVHRYEDRDQQLIDGALFLIVQGTNPEATLFLEAIKSTNADQLIWQFGIGRSSFAEIFVSYEDKPIHHEPAVVVADIFVNTNSYWRLVSKIKDNAGQFQSARTEGR